MRIATDLVNTCRRGEERLRSAADLRRFLLDHAEPEPVEVTEADVAGVRAVRARLRAVYEAERDAEAAAVLNDLLARYATRPYLTDHDGSPWHLHVNTMDAGWPESLAAMAAMGLATVAAGYGLAAIRTCAAPGCDAVFVTTTRQRIRRYCSPACATRTRVSAHRARRRGVAS